MLDSLMAPIQWKDVWKSVTMESGGPSVMTIGVYQMLTWSVISLDMGQVIVEILEML